MLSIASFKPPAILLAMKSRVVIAMMMAVLAIPFTASATATRPIPVPPEHGRKPEVSVWRNGAKDRVKFSVFEDAYLQGGNLAAGDLDGDGIDEIVVGSGPGRINEVRIFEADGKEIRTFRAYPEWFFGGVRIAIADTDGDGKSDIVTAPGPGIAPLVQIFNADGSIKHRGISAYNSAFQGGVHVAAADLDKDGKVEIITSPGPGGGPHVRFFDGALQNLGKDKFVFDAGMRDGVTIASIRTPWGNQLVAGVESWSEPYVRRFSFDRNGARLDSEFLAFASSSRSGVSLAAYDADGDGNDEIATAQNGGTAPEVRIYDVYGTLSAKHLLHDPTYRGALSMTQVRGSGKPALASINLAPVVAGPTDQERFIYVDLNDQRLYAYEHGRIAKTFFISSGTRTFPTPEIDSAVLEKIPIKRYKWNYGPGNPNNYDLPNVKWNLRFYGPMYIHGAYWHHNFGYRMSHGCVNVDYPDAEWIYNWADIGIPVRTRYALPKFGS